MLDSINLVIHNKSWLQKLGACFIVIMTSFILSVCMWLFKIGSAGIWN